MAFGTILMVGTRFLPHREPSPRIDARVDPDLVVEEAIRPLPVEPAASSV
jgi:hypothetical protein